MMHSRLVRLSKENMPSASQSEPLQKVPPLCEFPPFFLFFFFFGSTFGESLIVC